MTLYTRRFLRPLTLLSLAFLSIASYAAVVQGRVTDTLGAGIAGARVTLISKGQIVATTNSGSDGTYTVRSAKSGRFYVIVASQTFKQITTHSFYAGTLQAHEEDIVLEPAAVHQEVVVTATGTPIPQAQLSSAITMIQRPVFRNQAFLIDALRQSPGVFVVQEGMYGGVTSLFVRGGTSSGNRIVLDGTPIEDIGGYFDYSNVVTTGVSDFELYRGPNTVLYGSDAATGVVSLKTPQGSTAFPSLFYEGDAGNFHTWRNELQVGGTKSKLDYYGGADYFESSNALTQDEYRNLSEVANLGYALFQNTVVRVTARNNDSSVGLPDAYDFYHLTNDGKQGDQDTFMSALVDQQTTESWHNSVQYGMTRKREQANQWYPAGLLLGGSDYGAGNYYGNVVTIRGANGYSATGQALLNYGPADFGVYPNETESANNRDQLYGQSSYTVSPHLAAVLAVRYEQERGEERSAAYFYNDTLTRTNFDYTGEVQGNLFKYRVYYSLGGGIEKNDLFGTVGEPRIGLTYYPVRPGRGMAHGSKITFNFSKGVQEPSIFQQFDSLHGLLLENGEGSIVSQYHIGPINYEAVRTYDGGVEQSFFNQRLLMDVNYFHNELGNQIEFVNASLLPSLGVPQAVATEINSIYVGADVNTLAYRAQGIEVEFQSQIATRFFARGGYTYNDAVVQRSFASSAESPVSNPLFPSVEIGATSPLVGSRPFRQPPHVGFVSLNYTGKKLFATIQGSFAGRSNDSTFLSYSDVNFGNTLLLPNRDLDFAYAKIDIGGSYQFMKDIAVYAQLNNLTNDQHIGPIGYPALPISFRAGVRLQLGHQKQQ
jgi:iron complex outermembrane receptor protein/vitamin B12 transporter